MYIGNFLVLGSTTERELVIYVYRQREPGLFNDRNRVYKDSVPLESLEESDVEGLAKNLFVGLTKLFKKSTKRDIKSDVVLATCKDYINKVIAYIKNGVNLNDIEEIIQKPDHYIFCIDDDIDMCDVDDSVKEFYANRKSLV